MWAWWIPPPSFAIPTAGRFGVLLHNKLGVRGKTAISMAGWWFGTLI